MYGRFTWFCLRALCIFTAVKFLFFCVIFSRWCETVCLFCSFLYMPNYGAERSRDCNLQASKKHHYSFIYIRWTRQNSFQLPFFPTHYKCHLKSVLMPGLHAGTGKQGMPQWAGTDGERAKLFFTSEGKRNQCKQIFMWHLLTVFFLQAVSVLSFKRCKYIHSGLAGTCEMGCEDGWSSMWSLNEL